MSADTAKGDKLNEYDRMAVVRNHKDNNREMDECDCAERRNQKDTPWEGHVTYNYCQSSAPCNHSVHNEGDECPKFNEFYILYFNN